MRGCETTSGGGFNVHSPSIYGFTSCTLYKFANLRELLMVMRVTPLWYVIRPCITLLFCSSPPTGWKKAVCLITPVNVWAPRLCKCEVPPVLLSCSMYSTVHRQGYRRSSLLRCDDTFFSLLLTKAYVFVATLSPQRVVIDCIYVLYSKKFSPERHFANFPNTLPNNRCKHFIIKMHAVTVNGSTSVYHCSC